MSATSSPVEAPGRVLSTLNPDGTRRSIRPRPSPGAFWRARRSVSYLLMAVFFLIPYLDMGGRPLILLDLPRREFTLFGTTFLSTDGLLFMLLFASCVIAILAFTALFGRVWCGWACPQTVYMEFLFRPLERLLEGGHTGSMMLDARPGLHPRRLAKFGLTLALSLFLAHTFLAYFVPVEELATWVRRSPVEHPTSFFIALGTTAMIFLDFAWFREQTCLVACPYGRLQSALLDRRSLIVGYDVRRGEPRMKGTKQRPAQAGDCIDCGLCVLTCPTGIDIREGLQMECIHCTQCMDACDAVMDKVGRPRGLIRYGSRDGFDGRRTRALRPRVVLYPLALAAGLGVLGFNLGTRADADVTILRGLGAPYSLEPGGDVVNQIRVKVVNRGRRARRYRIELTGVPGARLIAPINPLPVAAGRSATTSVFVVLPQSGIPGGQRPVAFRLSDGQGFEGTFPYGLVGPERDGQRHGEEPGEPTGAHGGGRR